MEGTPPSAPRADEPEEPVTAVDALGEPLWPLISAMHSCFDQKLVLPALMLFYSAIDGIGALEAPFERSSQQSFRKWVDDYLLKSKALPCNSRDLWAARCGILHTLSARSDLSRAGHVNTLLYAIGGASAAWLQAEARSRGEQDILVVEVADLLEGFQLGLSNYVHEVAADAARARTVKAAAEHWLVYAPASRLPGRTQLPTA